MIKYKNLNRNSGIHSYEFESTGIKILFTDGGLYLYNELVTGKSNIFQMKQLADNGSGLNSFIKKHVNKRYASKLR